MKLPAEMRLPVVLTVLLATLAIFPLMGETFYIQLLTTVMIMAIFAMSLDLLVGYTGLVSLGHAAFYGLAGYVLARLAPPFEAASLWTTLPLALAACAVFALFSGLLVLRTSGVYFIMVTLAFAQMLFFVFHDTSMGGGSDGIYLYSRPSMKVGQITLLNLQDRKIFFWFVLGLMTVVYLFLRRVLDSNFGRVLIGIKTNEHRLQALGFPTFRYKLACYILSGTLAGLAGYLAAAQFGFVNPEILGWHTSGSVLMMVILGGMGTLHGAALGAFALILLQELLSNEAWLGPLAKHWQLAMGLFIIAVALLLPKGLLGAAAYFNRRGNRGGE